MPTFSVGGPPGIANPTFVPSARPPFDAGEIAGMQFAFIRGRSDLRIDASLSRDDTETVYATVATDMAAVEAEFQRNFTTRPLIYVFAGTESYTEGFVRIFGYPRASATFVGENSVSFFEPSLRLIAVNWAAVSDHRPVAAIRHELTHLLTLDACSPRCDLVPAWLNEGQARLAEALVPGADWRLTRVRYEAASMAVTGTLIPLNTLVSQLAWNALTDWAGYFKYQESARAVELLREDVGGSAPIARVYERLRNGQNLAQAYAAAKANAQAQGVSNVSLNLILAANGIPPNLADEVGRYQAIDNKFAEQVNGGQEPTSTSAQSATTAKLNKARCVAAKALKVQVNPQFGQLDYNQVAVVAVPGTVARPAGPAKAPSTSGLTPAC